MTKEQRELDQLLRDTEPDHEVAKLKDRIAALEKDLEARPTTDDFPTLRELLNCSHSPDVNSRNFRTGSFAVATEPGCTCGSHIASSIVPKLPPTDPRDLEVYEADYASYLIEFGRWVMNGWNVEIINDKEQIKLYACTCNQTQEKE